MKNHAALRLTLAIGTAALLLDQSSKWLMLDVVGIANRPPVEATSFLNLVMVWNRGISFGLFSSGTQPLIWVAVSLAIVAILLAWAAKNHSYLVACALGLVIGGALGNVIDRLRFGAVADFFDFHFAGYHWPAFNIADSTIFIGVVLLCVDSMFKGNQTTHKNEGNAP